MEYNEVAAKWWADKLRHVSPSNFDMGETKNNINLKGMFLGTLLAAGQTASNETVDSFEAKLAETIKERVSQDGVVWLMCEYRPDTILSHIALETGISDDLFPWKTSMRITKNSVTVSYGYNAPYEELIPAETANNAKTDTSK